MAPGSLESKQFDLGYGDGMGFPEPGISIICETRLAQGQNTRVNFSSHGWGDSVVIRIGDAQLEVISREYWLNHKIHKVVVPLSR